MTEQPKPGQPTPAFRAARRRRVELHEALVGVEEAISAAAPGRMDAWRGAVVDGLGRLRDAFDVHVRVTEGPDGLYDEVLSTAPRLGGQIRRLADEHVEIREAIEREALRASDRSEEGPVDLMRDDLGRLMGRIVRHRQHGADLVWEAYNLDIGGTG
jgi:hypothetical protein